MGVWESERGHVSDGMADTLDDFFKNPSVDEFKKAIKFIGEKCWLLKEDNLPTMSDLADCLEFCSFGVFKVEFSKTGRKYKKLYIRILYIPKLRSKVEVVTMKDMALLIERCTRKIYKIEFRDNMQDWKVEDLNEEKIPKAIPNRGQIKRGSIG